MKIKYLALIIISLFFACSEEIDLSGDTYEYYNKEKKETISYKFKDNYKFEKRKINEYEVKIDSGKYILDYPKITLIFSSKSDIYTPDTTTAIFLRSDKLRDFLYIYTLK